MLRGGGIPMRVTVLGLGIIGSAWAVNLHADGHALRTWNRTPGRGRLAPQPIRRRRWRGPRW